MEWPEKFFASKIDWFRVGVLVHGIVGLVNLLLDYGPLSGPDGLFPCPAYFSHIESEYPLIELLKNFPSLLYFVDGDTLILTAVAIAFTGLLFFNSQIALRASCFAVYVTLLSFSACEGVVLWFPWDCLLLELLVIAAVCPNTVLFPVLRFLLFRVMFGFGKHKFLGADSFDDLTYTASMSCWQPLGTNLGWYLTWLPDLVHIGALFFTFFAEMIGPFLLFSDRWVWLGCLATVALMAMIQVTGHFGWFNTLTALLAFAVMGTQKIENCMHFRANCFLKIYYFLAIPFIIPSQWNSPSLFYQHTFASPAFDLIRLPSAYRILHTYGVFPPKKMPMIKPVALFEVTLEDGTNRELEYHYQSPNSPSWPLSVAPFRFPRFDYIYPFYAGSHIFSLGTRLGPAYSGSGDHYIASVVRMIESGSPHIGKLFKTEIVSPVKKVRTKIVGLVPGWDSRGWVRQSEESDYFASHRDPGDYTLSPQMFVLRTRSRSFKLVRDIIQSQGFDGLREFIQTTNNKGETLLNAAIVAVARKNEWMSEREWFWNVEQEFERLRGELKGMEIPTLVNRECDSKETAIYDLCHSIKFGGYMGCLTSAHLLPPFVHSPLCPDILIANARHRNVFGDAFSKIPISDTVYWILGLARDVGETLEF